MHLKSLTIKNFRALEEIQVEFDGRVNVIVGPNAIGKTTVLEAIRLAKALLAPRTQNEPTQALIALGAVAPYNPQHIILDRIARDVLRPVEIRCRYELTQAEVTAIEGSISEIATGIVQARMGQAFAANPAVVIPFLSSPAGQAALTQANSEVRTALDAVRANQRSCRLELTIGPAPSGFQNPDPLGAALVAFLENRHAPSQTGFSYFPADRAMPQGETPVQLGAADAAQQLESHNSQPQTKYVRLKNTIFNAVVTSADERAAMDAEFARIFDGLLKGRKLLGVGVNQHGLLSISVQDTETNRIIDLDGMSSGEKGLILTFLLIGRTIVDDGIILLDEPELHLNPAVCRGVLSFLVDHYIIRKNIQAIICSHSPDILTTAFDRDECSLYRIVSESLLTKVRYQDQDEVSEALRALGTSESEGLLYRATIFVEGEEDVELLEAGFGELLRRHKLKDLGGRREVEKQISRLQEAERRGDKLTPRYFIFDRDEAPSSLTSTETIKVLQWNRRCLENYLIDLDVLTDLLKDGDVVKEPLANQGEVSNLLRALAMGQLDEFVARQVYASYGFTNPGLRASEIEGKNPAEIANILFTRLSALQGQVSSLTETWKDKFIADCAIRRRELEPVWETKWREDCDGKQLFKDLQQRVTLKMPLRRFKKRVVQFMRRTPPTEPWRAIESLLKGLIG